MNPRSLFEPEPATVSLPLVELARMLPLPPRPAPIRHARKRSR